MVHHMVTNGVAPTIEGFYHTFWLLYNNGTLKRHDWDQQTGSVIKKKPPVAFSGYDAAPEAYSFADLKAKQQQDEQQKNQAKSILGMMGGMAGKAGLGGAFGGELLGVKFYGKGLTEILKGQEPAVEFQQAVMNQVKKDWGGGSAKAPPPYPKPKQVDSVPDHGGARRFRDEED
jgi:hypothetical protein